MVSLKILCISRILPLQDSELRNSTSVSVIWGWRDLTFWNSRGKSRVWAGKVRRRSTKKCFFHHCQRTKRKQISRRKTDQGEFFFKKSYNLFQCLGNQTQGLTQTKHMFYHKDVLPDPHFFILRNIIEMIPNMRRMRPVTVIVVTCNCHAWRCHEEGIKCPQLEISEMDYQGPEFTYKMWMSHFSIEIS